MVKIKTMKKLIVLIPLLALLSCGESKEEKQKRLSDQLNHNIDSIAKAGKNKVDSLDKLIKASKTADSIAAEISKAINGK